LLSTRQPERVYEAAVVSTSRAKVAYDYLRYLRSHGAQDVWQRHGFSPGK
jgi:ABC-type molybdate transport system substrate-binding protein